VIVDAHIHFWDPSVLEYPWLPDALRHPHVEFGGRAVVVEADARGDELSWLERLEPEAIVAHAPLEEKPDLEALAARPLVKGVRRLLQGTDLFEAVREGVRELARHGLPFDACITQDQLPKLIALAAACDETTIVLDHLGKPRALDPWRAQLTELAGHENVVCKLSGLTTEVTGDVRPYLEHALEVFGSDRCLFGSDWPVASLTTTYEQWLDVVSGLLSEAERGGVLAANAERVYGLDKGLGKMPTEEEK
jgi:L-fuconolactonase